MAAIVHADIGDAGLLRFFDGKLHGPAGRDHAHGRIAVDDSPRSPFLFYRRDSLRVQTARLHLADIIVQIVRAVREHAERVRRHERIGDRLRILRADPRCLQSLLRKPQKLIYLNCFHVVFLLLETLFDCTVDLALNEVFLQAQIRHNQRQDAQHCGGCRAVHILCAVRTTEKLPDQQHQRVFRRLL